VTGAGTWTAIKPDRVNSKPTAVDITGVRNTPADRGSAAALVIRHVGTLSPTASGELTIGSIGHSKVESDISGGVNVDAERRDRESICIITTGDFGS
jgi:hypothetical protein